jgi:hypothetical protein
VGEIQVQERREMRILQMSHNVTSRGKAVMKRTPKYRIVQSPAGKKRKW